jgi:hypothetical protein
MEDILRMSYFQTNSTLSAHLVTAEPPDTFATLADCTLATGGNYAGILNLTDIGNNSSNRIADLGSGLSKLQMASAFWNNLTTDGTPITGIVISQYGTGSTTKCISYIERKVGGIATTHTPDGSPFTFNLSTEGVFRLDQVDFAFNWMSFELMKQNNYWSSNGIRFHLVTSAPPATATTLADCTLATGSGYASLVGADLSGSSVNRIQRTANVIRYVMVNPVWNGASTDAPITGLVASENGTAGTTRVLSYVPRTGGAYQLDGSIFSMDIETAGFLKVTV